MWPIFLTKGAKMLSKDQAMGLANKALNRQLTAEEFTRAFVDPETKQQLEYVKKL